LCRKSFVRGIDKITIASLDGYKILVVDDSETNLLVAKPITLDAFKSVIATHLLQD
jgi:hypothetical protein